MHFKKKKKKKKRRKSKVFRRSLQLWMMNTPYTGEKYIRNRYGGLTRQKRSKETVSSHKSLGVSKQKTTSKVYICMYVCTHEQWVEKWGWKTTCWKVPAASRTGSQSCWTGTWVGTAEVKHQQFLMAFVSSPTPLYALTILLNLRGGLVLGEGLQNCHFGFLILNNCP